MIVNHLIILILDHHSYFLYNDFCWLHMWFRHGYNGQGRHQGGTARPSVMGLDRMGFRHPGPQSHLAEAVSLVHEDPAMQRQS